MEKAEVRIDISGRYCGPVLYFEDRKISRSRVVRALRKAGIKVKAFAAPESARAAIQANGFRAALLDIVDAQTEPAGLTIAADFRKHHPAAYLEIVTAYDEDRYRRRADELGVDRYTTKPVKAAELVEHLKMGVISCGLKKVARKHSLDYRDFSVDVLRAFGLTAHSSILYSLGRILEEFSSMLRHAVDAEGDIDPLWLAGLEEASERLWDEVPETSSVFGEIALLLLKSVRSLCKVGPDRKKCEALLQVAEILRTESLSETDVLRADQLLVDAGLDVVVALEKDETLSTDTES